MHKLIVQVMIAIEQLRLVNANQSAILKVLRLRTPGMVWVRYLEEMGMVKFKFELVLPKAGASDVTTREVIVMIAGVAGSPQTLAGTALVSEPLIGSLGDTVEGTLVDVDASGNRSEARTFSFVIEDKFAPPLPGEVGINQLEQIEDEAPVDPVDPVDPEAPVDPQV